MKKNSREALHINPAVAVIAIVTVVAAMAVITMQLRQAQTIQSEASEGKDKKISHEKPRIDCAIAVFKNGQTVTEAKVNDELIIKATIAGGSTEETSFKIKIGDQTVCRSSKVDKYGQNCETNMVGSGANSSAQISFIPKIVGTMDIKTEVGNAKCHDQFKINILPPP